METKKKRPVIAVDVDGVLRNNLWIMVDIYNSTFGTKLKVQDVREYLTEISFPMVRKVLGMSPDRFFFKENAKEIFLNAPPYYNVSDNISALKDIADIIIVTYQKDYANKAYTLEWLERNRINPDGICFLKDKTLVHCDALIDDNDWNFIGTYVGTSVLVTQPYNERLHIGDFIGKTNSRQMIRVRDFNDFTSKYIKGEITI